MITRSVMHDLLGKCNVPEEKIETFEQRYVEEFGEHARLCPGNVISTKRLEVKTPEVVVKVSPDRSDLALSTGSSISLFAPRPALRSTGWMLI